MISRRELRKLGWRVELDEHGRYVAYRTYCDRPDGTQTSSYKTVDGAWEAASKVERRERADAGTAR